MSKYKLATEIIARSNSSNWDEAKREWQLSTVYFEDDPQTCLCGHFPIIEICVIHNILNSNSAEVGNCCVKKFLGLPSDLIFQAVKRIRENEEKSLNSEAIDYAHSKRWINDWERNFYTDTMRKRALTEKQTHIKRQINQKVLSGISRSRPNL